MLCGLTDRDVCFPSDSGRGIRCGWTSQMCQQETSVNLIRIASSANLNGVWIREAGFSCGLKVDNRLLFGERLHRQVGSARNRKILVTI